MILKWPLQLPSVPRTKPIQKLGAEATADAGQEEHCNGITENDLKDLPIIL